MINDNIAAIGYLHKKPEFINRILDRNGIEMVSLSKNREAIQFYPEPGQLLFDNPSGFKLSPDPGLGNGDYKIPPPHNQ